MAKKSTEFISTGGGMLYIQLWVAGVLSDDISYFGITDEVLLSSAVDQIEHINTETSTQRTDAKVGKKKTAMIKFKTAEVSPAMLSRAFIGATNIVSQTIATAEAVVVSLAKIGYTYDLGYVGITSIVVQDSGDTITYVEGVDYSLDKNAGLITMLEGGTFAADAEIHVAVTAPAVQREIVAALKGDSLNARLIFVSDPQSGEKWKYTFKKVSIVSQGDIALKSDDFAMIEFEGEALVDESVTDPNLSDYFDAEVLPND